MIPRVIVLAVLVLAITTPALAANPWALIVPPAVADGAGGATFTPGAPLDDWRVTAAYADRTACENVALESMTKAQLGLRLAREASDVSMIEKWSFVYAGTRWMRCVRLDDSR